MRAEYKHIKISPYHRLFRALTEREVYVIIRWLFRGETQTSISKSFWEDGSQVKADISSVSSIISRALSKMGAEDEELTEKIMIERKRHRSISNMRFGARLRKARM